MLLRILIADDEPIELKVLNKIVKDSGLPAVIVDGARSGTEALERAERYMPDLIFMDIRMPGMNGLDVSAIIKQKQPDTTIAIVTAYDEFHYAKRAIDIHVDYLLVKPVDPADVERIIRETIEGKLEATGENEAVLPGISLNRAQLARDIVELLHDHYSEPITLLWLEERMKVSQQYLSRTFKHAYNMTIMGYLTQFRMKLAIKLLADPALSIATIAERIGIPDASYFGQLFKQAHRVTPSQYRNQCLPKTARNT
ncbi:DNA-binding response regulator [Paenibacillus baekrokdamisoli]|uniref:DNA-binding response regulator n=1 Tax=Paenibacillus baekrokdamisoli TaxID=1712516 RepID=A0A3G9IQG9_9BACL|nr:response regulator [Paenibacillus baekrokdamisoli]MBB3070025.1 YesN/AraC family two-component response regulator [Paenibacillus baekrokdamisoli]BBH20626.1 DNA-binding response regulator [Paenibacillus baekrokdamisoli]